MPLYKTITVNQNTKVFIWKIEETFDTLCKDISLTEKCTNRVANMKSEMHKCGFMSIRHLLAEAGYTDHNLYYDENGKPHLDDGRYISITHSFNFSAIIVADNKVGIDIEKQRNKIIRIGHKFTPIEEYRTIANDDALIRKLTIVWCAKESLYKSFAEKGVSFLQNIDVTDFDLDSKKTIAKVVYGDKEEFYDIDFLEFEGFTCAYALVSK